MQKINLNNQIVDITDNAGAAYDGKLLVCSGSVTIDCGDPAAVPDDFECVVVKRDNGSGYVKIQGVGGYSLNDWMHVILAMQSDNVRIVPHAASGVWYVLGASAGAVRGAPRPHRTVVASNYPNQAYNCGEADLGGVVRCYADAWPMNLNLPTAPQIGRPSGYAGSTNITMLKVPGSAHNVDAQAQAGSSIAGQPRWALPNNGQHLELDFDSAEWWPES